MKIGRVCNGLIMCLCLASSLAWPTASTHDNDTSRGVFTKLDDWTASKVNGKIYLCTLRETSIIADTIVYYREGIKVTRLSWTLTRGSWTGSGLWTEICTGFWSERRPFPTWTPRQARGQRWERTVGQKTRGGKLQNKCTHSLLSDCLLPTLTSGL